MTPMISTIQTILSALASEFEAELLGIGNGLFLYLDKNILVILLERSVSVKKDIWCASVFRFQDAR
jgi:hypothetical protein